MFRLSVSRLFHVDHVVQSRSKHCSNKRAARAVRLFFLVQPIVDLWQCRSRCRRRFLNSPLRVLKDIFVTRDRTFLFPVKCEMANFSLVNRDFHGSREA